MDALDIVLLVFAGLLVPFAGLMAAADAAIIMVSPARVEEAQREGRRGAASLSRIVADKPRYTNLLLLLRVGSECAATVLVAAVALSTWGFHFWVLVLIVVVMIVVTYVVIGVLPRTIGRQHPSGVGFFLAGTVAGLGRFLSPIASLLILIGNAITPGRGFREGPFSSEIELRELVDMAQVHGVVEESEREMLHSVFQLGDTIAREVMVPRTEVVWIERHKSMRQALQLASRSGLSRIPVVGDDVDDITGVIYIKDLVASTLAVEPGSSGPPVGELVRAPFFVPDSKPVPDLLAEMQRTRTHFAVVVDEYGGTAGIVTIEDILEEIVGEITDEYDAETPELIEMLGDGRYRVSTRVLVEDLGELFDVSLPAEDVETVGGLFAQLLGRVPLPMSEADINGLHLLGEPGVDRRGRPRVMSLIISRIADPDNPALRDEEHPSAPSADDADGADDPESRRDDGGSTGAEKSAKADKPERPKGKSKSKNKNKQGKAPRADRVADAASDDSGAADVPGGAADVPGGAGDDARRPAPDEHPAADRHTEHPAADRHTEHPAADRHTEPPPTGRHTEPPPTGQHTEPPPAEQYPTRGASR